MSKFAAKLALVFIAPLIFVACYFFCISDPYHLSAPKDGNLINIFKKNEIVFSELRNMALQEGEAIIIPKERNSRIPAFRKDHYDQLLAKIGNPTLISGGERIKWVYASGGILTIGSEWTKGISFDLDCAEENQRQSLDIFPAPAENTVYCRAIEGNWWVNVSIWI
jgi:hypothetical protein